jgi:outer membrane protein OmpA-like peptidoglycan-associated protein
VSLFDSKFELLSETVSNEKGYYEFDITCEEKYTVRSEMLSYDTKEGEIIIPNTSGKSVLSLALKQPVKKGTDIAKILDLEIIYFDFDKWFIREDAAIELEKVLTFMQEYPNIKVDVRSHTDSRGTHRYNEFLSDKRAHSTRIWLIDKGISASRLTARGYGETQLVNHCKDCIKCTKEEHQANRRSEFIIVSVGTE